MLARLWARVCLCLSVCHTPVLYRNGYTRIDVTIQYSAYDFLFAFNRNYASVLYHYRDIHVASYLLKLADFNLPHLDLAPPVGVIPFEFRQNLRFRENYSPELS